MIRKIFSIAALCALGALIGAPSASAKVPADPASIKPVKVGATAPGFTARRPDGSEFSFKPKALEKPVVLIFYRGGWCPYCNAHLGQLRTTEPKLRQMGYDVLFMSADRPELLVTSLKQKDLGYTLLSDAPMTAARAFGVAFRLDDATVKIQKQFGADLEAASGQTHHELPVPSVFVLDKHGVVRFVHWDPNYKVRMSGEDILRAAQAALPIEGEQRLTSE